MNVMIIDMGHSNFQCSLCQFVKGKMTVLGTVADPNFGCRNFDNMLVTYFAKLFKVCPCPVDGVILTHVF